MLFPLVTRAFGVVAAMFGVMVVRTDDREDPRSALGARALRDGAAPRGRLRGRGQVAARRALAHFFACGMRRRDRGASAFLHVTQYYTEHRYRPGARAGRGVARGADAGAPLRALAPGSRGPSCRWACVVAAVFAAFELGARTGLAHGGLYGTAVATMGMLGPAAYLLAMDAFGPIVDNAAGIVEMTVARERPDVRGRTVVLDAVGNTVKALTKAWAAGAAALGVAAARGGLPRRGPPAAARARSAARGDRRAGRAPRRASCSTSTGRRSLVAAVAGRPPGPVAGVALHRRRARRPARRVMDEVRRQLKDRPARRSSPDHEACIEMVTRGGPPSHARPGRRGGRRAPLAVGVALRFARAEDNPLLLADSVAALVMAGTIAGVLGSLLLGNAGGAWDNAKKYIATGAHGGRHLVDESGARVDNPTYAAALVGDTVGDPLKDLAGPAMHVLVKMLPVVTIVFLPFFV